MSAPQLNGTQCAQCKWITGSQCMAVKWVTTGTDFFGQVLMNIASPLGLYGEKATYTQYTEAWQLSGGCKCSPI